MKWWMASAKHATSSWSTGQGEVTGQKVFNCWIGSTCKVWLLPPLWAHLPAFTQWQLHWPFCSWDAKLSPTWALCLESPSPNHGLFFIIQDSGQMCPLHERTFLKSHLKQSSIAIPGHQAADLQPVLHSDCLFVNLPIVHFSSLQWRLHEQGYILCVSSLFASSIVPEVCSTRSLCIQDQWNNASFEPVFRLLAYCTHKEKF